jgi:hypothetical protein
MARLWTSISTAAPCWFLAGVLLALSNCLPTDVARASPESEKQLVGEAQQHIDTLYSDKASKSDKAKALIALKSVTKRIDEAAAADPNFDKRPFNDALKALKEDLPGFLAEQSKLYPPPQQAQSPTEQPPTYKCTGLPIPTYASYPGLKKLAVKLDNAMAELEAHLKTTKQGTLADVVKWQARRDRLLETVVVAQVELALTEGGRLPTAKLVELMTATDKLLEATTANQAADAKAQELIKTHAEYRKYFDNMKQDFADGSGYWDFGFGTSPAGIGAVGWWSQVIVERIEKLWKQQNELFRQYLLLVAPIEKGARELINMQLKSGIARINFRLEQEGSKRKFELFRPGSKQRRELIDRIIARMIKERLRIFVRDSANLVDWNQAKTFEFATDGKSCTGSGDRPKSAEQRPTPSRKKTQQTSRQRRNERSRGRTDEDASYERERAGDAIIELGVGVGLGVLGRDRHRRERGNGQNWR